jgi:predicted enzyme related to lactoylglutathione lyase
MFKPGIGFHYNVSNLKRTIEFYTEKLGFKVLDYDENMREARLQTNTRDCIIGFAERQPVLPGSTCITFEVEDIENAVQSLQQKDIEFEGPIVEVPNLVKLAAFTDPDGYNLMLFSPAQHRDV